MFISVDGKSKEVTDIFAGGTDGKAHRVTEMFGSVDGIAKLVYSNEEKESSAFDQFTWAEIKQLADEGKLLEHFKQFDRVYIKLKEPLRKDLSIYISGHGFYRTVPQVQTEIMFQIAEVTETKMRLMCPRVTALGGANTNITTNPNVAGIEKSKFLYYANDYYNNINSARSLVDVAWGLTEMYENLKAIQNALPDDLVNVLSVCARPLIEYSKHSITNAVQTKYDEDLRVRQITDDILVKKTDMSNNDIFYPIIEKSYYPTDVTEYMHYIRMPDEFDTYEQRMYTARNRFNGVPFLDHKRVSGYIKQSFTTSPYASWGFTDGITNNDDYNKYLSAGGVKNDYSATGFTIIPEIIIEAD